MPLWKLKLTEEEYTNLKETLVQNAYRLEDFGIEAALCYAEWWRRDYNGGIPSREDVAVGLGLPHYCWEQLYKAARHGLKSHGFAFIHSLKGNEYFRTLLNQGGLPVNYIKNGTNLSGFSRFLIGLVEELSSINIDWDDNNIDLIKNFNCIAYLGKAFKNDNYDGDVYALPVSENIKPAELVQIKLEPYNRQMNLFTIPDELLNSEAILFSGPESSRRLVPKYYNFEQEDYSSEVRGEMSAANTILWSERLCKDDVFAGEYWAKTVKAFRIISEFNLPFTTYNAFKAIGCEPKLLVNLILACWINGASDVLIQEIDRFEDELNIAVHWIPHTVWGECIESFIRSLPPTLINIMNTKLGEITELINALFNATLSAEVASELTQYVAGGNIGNARIFSRADINQFKSKIHGCTDNNIDLPLTRFVLQNKYYVDQEMHKSYRVMIESAMCAAENFAQVKNRTNLFLLESRDYARIINFYRKYFKETYSEIFIGTVKQIVNK